MKKLKLKSTLNHKAAEYAPQNIEVEKVVTLYGKSFENMKNDLSKTNPYISENRDLMYIDSNDTVHCVLFVDSKSGDGLLVDSEGSDYARKSQFIPNAKALIESNAMTEAERTIHEMIAEITDRIAETAHCGERHFCCEDILNQSVVDEILGNTVCAVNEMLQAREDIQHSEIVNINVPYQNGINVETEPTQELKFCCPLKIVRECDESEYDYDEEVIYDQEEIPSRYAVDCADEINEFIRNYSEPKEEHRGLMVYYDKNPSINEKVISAIPSVREINGELMGVFECRITDELTDNELEDLREYLTGQASDGWGESFEQRPIKTVDYGEIYVSLWNSGSGWSLQTEEEFEMSQAEEIQPGMSL